jgi:hypothetical protein
MLSISRERWLDAFFPSLVIRLKVHSAERPVYKQLCRSMRPRSERRNWQSQSSCA